MIFKIAITAFALMLGGAGNAQTGPSYEDTVKFLREKIPSEYERSRGNHRHSHRYSLEELGPCQFALDLLEDITGPAGASDRSSFRLIDRFALKDFDPTAITMREMSGEYEVRARTNRDLASVEYLAAPLPGCTRPDCGPESRSNGVKSSITFMVENKDDGERAIRALSHLITLCGGKAQLF
jgi:hypothetical protein